MYYPYCLMRQAGQDAAPEGAARCSIIISRMIKIRGKYITQYAAASVANLGISE